VFYVTSWPDVEKGDDEATVPFWLLFSLSEAAQQLSSALPLPATGGGRSGGIGGGDDRNGNVFRLDAQASLFTPVSRNNPELRGEVTRRFVEMLQVPRRYCRIRAGFFVTLTPSTFAIFPRSTPARA
jgi:hypothetical protein